VTDPTPAPIVCCGKGWPVRPPSRRGTGDDVRAIARMRMSTSVRELRPRRAPAKLPRSALAC